MKILNQIKRFLQIIFSITAVTAFILYSFIGHGRFIHEDANMLGMHPLNLSGLPQIPNSSIDSGRRNNVLWPSDPECKRYSVHFGKNMTFVYLASFPRSGNTWTRYLIEAASGIFTGTAYVETQALALNFFGSLDNPHNSTTIIAKTHFEWGVNWPPKFAEKKPVVLLIRRPERAVMSFWNYGNANESTKFFYEVPISSYASPEFHAFVEKMTVTWRKTTISYIQNAKKLLVIFYENILKDPLREVKKIIQFLGYEADPGRLQCLKKYPDGHAKRKHKEIDPYTAEEKLTFALNMFLVIKSLQERGIEIPQEYLDYVEKKISI